MQSDPFLCPACAIVQGSTAPVCDSCGLELTWLDRFPRARAVLGFHALSSDETTESTNTIPAITRAGTPILLQAQIPTAVSLNQANCQVMTSSDGTSDPSDCWIIPWHDDSKTESPLPRLFVIAASRQSSVSINRLRVLAAELVPGDVLQIGVCAWCFSGLDLHLIPLIPTAGIGIQLDGVHIRGRLGPELSLKIQPGQFVAIVGRSGAGKSSLLKVLAGFQRDMESGSVTIVEPDGTQWIRSHDPERFRQSLGYVSQDAILHEDLTARQILTLSSQLRGRVVSETAVESALLRAEIDRDRWENPVRNLSGGENKRLRTASELMGEPRLLLLDEPDSGLDEIRRTALMRFLRTLSWQGCTVVLVTHQTSHLSDYCDRNIEIHQGHIERDRQVVSTAHCNIPSATITPFETERPLIGKSGRLLPLLLREVLLIVESPFRRIGLPAGIAGLFSVAISVATTPTGTPMLGFLAIISVLWMSASLSLLAIAGERVVFDHERKLFLSIPNYVISKFLVYGALSCCQTLIFTSAVWVTRSVLHRECLHSPVQTYLTLCLVGVAGTSLGLLLSAVAGTRKETATGLLPRIMVAQIVFSVPIATDDGMNSSVRPAYADFHTYRCPCGRYATEQSMVGGSTQWLCPQCRMPVQTPHTPSSLGSHVSSKSAKRKSSFREPIRLAAWASYATISRPADIALRGFSYFGIEATDQELNRRCLRAVTTIVFWVVALVTKAGLALRVDFIR